MSSNNKKILAHQSAEEAPRRKQEVSLDILLAEAEDNTTAGSIISRTLPGVHGDNIEKEEEEQGEKEDDDEDELSGIDEHDFNTLMENIGDEELFNSFMERMKTDDNRTELS
jgi:hypothetical protein